MIENSKSDKINFFLAFIILLLLSIGTFISNRNSENYYDNSFYYERFNNYKISYDKEDYFSAVTGNKVGYNYYSDLARSIVEYQKLYLYGPYHPELSQEDNPYSQEALDRKIIIQDASYFNGKYYLYWGPLPLLLYIPVKYIFGFYPSDFFVTSIILFVSLCFFLLFSYKVLNSNTLIFGETLKKKLIMLMLIFSIIYLNPLPFLNTFFWSGAHSISRLIGLHLIVLSFLYIYLESFKKNINFKNLIFFNFICSLSILTKQNFIIFSFFVGIYTYFILKEKSHQKSKLPLLLFSPLFICLIVFFSYNYLRFSNIFETGFTFITNGLDFTNPQNKPIIFSTDIELMFKLVINRFYEYFLAFPSMNLESMKFENNMNTVFDIEIVHSMGNYGIFLAAPYTLSVMKIPYLIYKNKINIKEYTMFINFLLTLAVYFVFIGSVTDYGYEILISLLLALIVIDERFYTSSKLKIFSFIISLISCFIFTRISIF